MQRNVLTIVAIHWPGTDSTSITCVAKEVTGSALTETTDVYHSVAIEAMWEEGQDVTLRHRALKAIESFVQRSRLDSPE